MPTLHPVLVVLALALVPLAGCLGGEEPVAPAAADAPATEAGTVPASAPAVDVEADAPATADVTVVPFSWDGTVGRTACLPSGPSACTGPPVSVGDGDTFQDTAERATRATLTLSWTAETPLTEEMFFALVAAKPCGERCWEFRGLHDATGPSPLAFEDAALDLAEDETLAVHVGAAGLASCQHAAVVYGCARAVEQPFHVEGTLTVPGPAAAAAEGAAPPAP